MENKQSQLSATIKKYIENLDTENIKENRKQLLKPLIEFIQEKIVENENIRIVFICTHNSRRSHLAQVWAQTLAFYYGLKHVSCYSAGTEETAMYPMIAETLKNSGFKIDVLSKGKNPIYSIGFSENEPTIIGFSKKIAHDFNPKSNFAAIMTCSQADLGCPFVPGAEIRIPITFEDPKIYDDTDYKEEKYQERNRQIANEMKYVFSKIKTK